MEHHYEHETKKDQKTAILQYSETANHILFAQYPLDLYAFDKYYYSKHKDSEQ